MYIFFTTIFHTGKFNENGTDIVLLAIFIKNVLQYFLISLKS